MSLSKPSKFIFTLVGSYYEGLYNNPIKTKSITSCVVAVLANITSQYISQVDRIDQNSLIAFGLFGFLFGGSVPHVFFNLLENLVPHDSPRRLLKQLLVERILFTPIYQLFAVYMLARLEGKTHNQSTSQLIRMYWPLLKTNWTYLSVLHVLNLAYVPPLLQVLVNNLIGFIWAVFLSHKKRKADCRRNNLD